MSGKLVAPTCNFLEIANQEKLDLMLDEFYRGSQDTQLNQPPIDGHRNSDEWSDPHRTRCDHTDL
jgi:hypothetical protein